MNQSASGPSGLSGPSADPARQRRVVYIVAKAPRAGQSKTRLCPPLTPHTAATLAAAFLQDTVALALHSGADVRLICRDEAERVALGAFATDGVSVHVQPGAGLGDALEAAFTTGLADGYSAVAVLGMDTPTLPPGVISHALSLLETRNTARGADVAIGLSDDGGYYLLAARDCHPALFQNMTWSTSDVARETLARCATLGLRTALGATWQDVDDAPSLLGLQASLRNLPRDVAPHTRSALATFDLSESPASRAETDNPAAREAAEVRA